MGKLGSIEVEYTLRELMQQNLSTWRFLKIMAETFSIYRLKY